MYVVEMGGGLHGKEGRIGSWTKVAGMEGAMVLGEGVWWKCCVVVVCGILFVEWVGGWDGKGIKKGKNNEEGGL